MTRRKNKRSDDTAGPSPQGRVSARAVFFGALLVTGCLLAVYLAFFRDRGLNGAAEAATSRLRLEDIPFNGARAYGYLKQICALGPRSSGSAGMEAQQKLTAEHFARLGAQVEFQRFGVKHPVDGSTVAMANLIARWNPDRKERILLCAHYDTLPLPMLDPVNPRGTFVGANDGASGVALLMELAHEIGNLSTPLGIDVVLLDGEEFVFRDRDRYFLGSEYFARKHVEDRPPYRYRWGVLLDMIGDADLQLYQEQNSMWWRDVRPLVEEIWATAARLGVREFIPRKKHAVQDDHVPLHDIAGIPICDIIDFDYPAWHTQGDTPDQCSALSLAKVGWVIREWLAAAR
ncbi:MAG: M28 family peptidase [Pirellulales bacterium]|nr:M28 family peptidase [Pirellulales bacterium]